MHPASKNPETRALPVVVLCGGLGTRLHAVMAGRPKVLAPVAGRPFLFYLVQSLVGQGFTDIILSTGHLGGMVEAYAGTGEAWGARLRYAREPAPLGTGGGIRFAAEAAGLNGPIIALNGDTFFSGSLERLVSFHQGLSGARASMALVSVDRPRRYGTVRFSPETGIVESFKEKQAGASSPAWINAGVYVLEPALVESIPRDQYLSLEQEVFPGLVGRDLRACPFPDAAFLDIGTPEDYERAAGFLRANYPAS